MCISQPSANPQNLRMSSTEFDPESDGYDYKTAKASGMSPDGKGEDLNHWGSVAQASQEDKKKYGLPEDSYMILKGKNHPTFDKAVAGEEERGFQVIRQGSRYYSVPNPEAQEATFFLKP